MNLILSSKAAQRLQQEVQSREDFIPDINTWRIDCLNLRKRGIFIITQEKSLSTLISSYKQGIKGIIAQITATNQQKLINQTPFKYLSYRTPTECYQNLLNQSKELH